MNSSNASVEQLVVKFNKYSYWLRIVCAVIKR